MRIVVSRRLGVLSKHLCPNVFEVGIVRAASVSYSGSILTLQTQNLLFL